jgi:acyl-CoA hydrolase
MSQRIDTPAAALRAIRDRLGPGPLRIYVPGAAAEPLCLAESIRSDGELGRGFTAVGVWIPGINTTDWSQLMDGAETTFTSTTWAQSQAEGRMKILPLAYSQTWVWLSRTPLDVAIIQVAPPNAAGDCSLSLTADFADAILTRDIPVLGLINPLLPVIEGSPVVNLERFSWVLEAAHAPPVYDPGPADEISHAVAAQVIRLIPDRAVIQTGVGKLAGAVIEALRNHKGLKVHSGMVVDALTGLMDAGALDEAPGSITTGALMGSPQLGERLASDPRLKMVSVPGTHGYNVLSQIPRLAALNSALEVDLFGQANAERAGRRYVSSVGGLGDFLRGAGAAPDGLPILALPSEAGGGKISKIVPVLPQGVVTVGRTEIGIVVTEHGAADLRGLDVEARARALIRIAAPSRRDELARAWREMKT